MLTKAKTGKLKPNVFVAHTESEPTFVKQTLTKPEWANEMKFGFNSL